jgi:mannose-1-phosphate guanylyltransferase
MHHLYFLIMAGGEGVRFKPLSTPARPKQFINIVGDKSLIRQTFERLSLESWDVDPDHVYVATSARYIDLVRQELPELPVDNIIGETSKKNTAPCIAYAAHIIASRDPEGIMVVLPSDHVVLDHAEFLSVLKTAIDAAVKGERLVTLGIRPAHASSEYGYIERSDHAVPSAGHEVYCVKRFVEKPDRAKAEGYIATGRFYWNSGMFVWGARTVLREIARHLPELDGEIRHLQRAFDMSEMVRFFENAPSISIDYGVMERSSSVVVIPCEFGWSDIGTWQGLKSLADGMTVSIAPEVRKAMEEQLGSWGLRA